MVKRNLTEEFDPKIHVKEFKRTCKECDKKWHVLASREEKLEKDMKSNKAEQLTAACGMCGGNWNALGASTQAKRNEHALTDELTRLKQCPKCSSGNYSEEVIIYEKKNLLVMFSIFCIKKIWQNKLGIYYNNKKKIICRFYPSCSNYALQALSKYGFFEGWYLSIRRIKQCNLKNTSSCIDYP